MSSYMGSSRLSFISSSYVFKIQMGTAKIDFRPTDCYYLINFAPN